MASVRDFCETNARSLCCHLECVDYLLDEVLEKFERLDTDLF